MQNNGNFFGTLLKGLVFSLLITVVGILIFALVAYLCSLSNAVFCPVNQFIKIISIFLGVFLCKNKKNGLLFGLIFGVIYGIFTYLLFSGISGKFSLSTSMIVDVILSVSIGIISGIVCVNLNKEKD